MFSSAFCEVFNYIYFEAQLLLYLMKTSKGIFPNISLAKFMLKL